MSSPFQTVVTALVSQVYPQLPLPLISLSELFAEVGPPRARVMLNRSLE